jgi:hypothetical protein
VKLEGTEQKLTPTRHKPIRGQEKNQRRIQTFQKEGDNCIFCVYLLEQSHPVHSPLQVQTDLPSTSTVQDPSFRKGLGEQGLKNKYGGVIRYKYKDIPGILRQR